MKLYKSKNNEGFEFEAFGSLKVVHENMLYEKDKFYIYFSLNAKKISYYSSPFSPYA